jgi:hypothetical protein
MDFLPQYRAFGQHIFGISFRHRKLPRGNLIYVRDAIGMALFTDASLTEELQKSQILNPKFNGSITRTWLFQDTTIKDSLGNPKFLEAQKTTIEYSQFNMAFRVKKDQLTLLSLLSKESAKMILPLSIVMIIPPCYHSTSLIPTLFSVDLCFSDILCISITLIK